MKVEGGCHCGAIAFEAEINPDNVSICHCGDCQTLSGAPFRASVPVRSENLKFLRGAPGFPAVREFAAEKEMHQRSGRIQPHGQRLRLGGNHAPPE